MWRPEMVAYSVVSLLPTPSALSRQLPQRDVVVLPNGPVRHQPYPAEDGVGLIHVVEDSRAIHLHRCIALALQQLHVEPTVRSTALIRSCRDSRALPFEDTVESSYACRAEDHFEVVPSWRQSSISSPAVGNPHKIAGSAIAVEHPRADIDIHEIAPDRQLEPLRLIGQHRAESPLQRAILHS